MFNKKFLLIKKFEIFIFIFNSVLLTLKYKYIQATNCINIVERARPATPKAGIKNKPKIANNFFLRGLNFGEDKIIVNNLLKSYILLRDLENSNIYIKKAET